MSHSIRFKQAITLLIILNLIMTTSDCRIPRKFRPPAIKLKEKDYSILYETYPEL